MTQYIITGEPFGTRAQLSPYSLVATANLGVGQTINLTLSAQDEATLIAAGILQLYPGAGAYRGAWQPNWRYDANDVVLFAGSLYEANAAFTSGASFNAANWTQIAGGGGGGGTGNVTDRGAWAASTVYAVHDLVEYGGTDFLCAVAHTSGAAFDTTKWTELSQFRGAWQASTVYETGDIVAQGGSLYSANATFTSGASFTAANWTQLAGGGSAGPSVVQMDSGTAPTVDHATALVDQNGLYYDQASGKFKGAALLQTPATPAAGDLFYYNGATLSRVPIGSSTQVLTVTGGVPAWAAPSGGGGGSRIQAMQGALGLITENFRAPISANTTNATSQKVNAGLIGLLAGDVITNIIVGVNNPAVGTAPTLVRLGLADTTGKILAVTANVNSSTAFTALGFAVIPLSAPYTVPATGGYYALYLQNGAWGTTNLGLNYATGANTGNTLAITGGALFYAAQSSQTDLPAVGSSLTLTDAGNSASPLWYGVS